MQGRIQELVEHLKWSFLQKWLIFVISSISDTRLGSEYAKICFPKYERSKMAFGLLLTKKEALFDQF